MNDPHFSRFARDRNNRLTAAMTLASPSERTELENAQEEADIAESVGKHDRAFIVFLFLVMGMVGFWAAGHFFDLW